MKTIEQAQTVHLYMQLEQYAVSPKTCDITCGSKTCNHVKVMSLDRSIPRKEQARLARELFKRLKIKGISVTAPNYSMAQSVDVSVPALKTSDADFGPYANATYSDMPDDVPAKMKMLLHYEAKENARKILERAFPMHDDRSEHQSDYFDYKWSF